MGELADREGAGDGGMAADPAVRGWANNLPVIIIPGFGSSGLKIVQSTAKPTWEQHRIWLGLNKLGTSKFSWQRKRVEVAHPTGTVLVRVRQARAGLGRTVALRHRASTPHQIR